MKTTLHSLIESVWKELKASREEKNKERFNQLMLDVLPELKSYIKRRLKASVKAGKLPKNKYNVDDFISQIYLKAYDRINDFTDYAQFANWLFVEADLLLEETISEEELTSTFFEDIDEISKPELESMEEEFSVDADGDLMMIEEFDDPDLPHYDYTLDDVFVEDNAEKELVEKLTKEMTKEEIMNHIKFVTSQLPLKDRIIFELYLLHKLKQEQIARIRNIEEEKVEKTLNKVRTLLTKTLGIKNK